MRASPALSRLPLFLMGAICLLAGLAAGEARIGWDLPDLATGLVAVHGPLMVCGFFGTVIGLERATALARPWGWAAPALTGAGGLALMTGPAPNAAAALIALGGLVFAAMALAVLRRQPLLFTAVMALGAVSWLAGDLLWLAGRPVPEAVAAWAAFLVLTIAGERLDLSRFLKPTRLRTPTILVPLALLVAAQGLTVAGAAPAGRVLGLGLLSLAAWLARYDIARHTLKKAGLTRFMALCLLSGYVWLAVSGGLMLAFGLNGGGPAYDGALHALFIGFVFAMVFGHAPVIVPAVLRTPVPFTPLFYAPLALLHASVALRLAGDGSDWTALTRWGGLLNAVAILAFLLTVATVALRARRRNGQMA